MRGKRDFCRDAAARNQQLNDLGCSEVFTERVNQIGFRDEMRIRREILDTIGWQKLDLIVEKTSGPVRPIAEIARASGVEL